MRVVKKLSPFPVPSTKSINGSGSLSLAPCRRCPVFTNTRHLFFPQINASSAAEPVTGPRKEFRFMAYVASGLCLFFGSGNATTFPVLESRGEDRDLFLFLPDHIIIVSIDPPFTVRVLDVFCFPSPNVGRICLVYLIAPPLRVVRREARDSLKVRPDLIPFYFLYVYTTYL